MSRKESLLHAVADGNPPEEAAAIKKPEGKFDLSKFKSQRVAGIANVETLLGSLPTDPISHAKDLVRLHPDEENYWSTELVFIDVPIEGDPKHSHLHLIGDELAAHYFSEGKLKRFRLALATKPFNAFFLAQVPSQRLENSWNASNLLACEQAKTRWVQVTSRKAEGVEAYKLSYARDEDAFPEPKWPTQNLDDIIGDAFLNKMITHEQHPALLRLIGAKQKLT